MDTFTTTPTAAEPIMVEYATVSNKYDTRPVPQRKSLDAFIRSLSKPGIRPYKNGASFIPATFKPGGKRVDNDVESITMLVLDFDAGKIGIDDALATVSEYLAVAYTSFSHSEECAKFRLIIFLSTPIPPDLYHAVWTAFVSLFPAGAVDLSCSNLSRFYYLPACPNERKHLFEFRDQEGGVA